MTGKHVIVVGAGPGGLTAAMLLAARGYKVTVYEKDDRVGGRNQAIQLGPYTFDTGPTFLMMKHVLEEMFQQSGRRIEDYLDVRRIDPLYRLRYASGKEVHPTSDQAAMRRQIAKLFPGDEKGYDRFLKYEKKKYEVLVPCLQIPYEKPTDYLHPRFLRSIPYLDGTKDLYSHLGTYFKHDELKIAHTFQAKYLGMSPWECPATFSMIAYIEQSGGIHHPIGGLNRISHAMAQVIAEEGGEIHLESPVAEILVEGGRTTGVRLDSGAEERADYVVVNADFGHALHRLFPRRALRKWTPEKLERKNFSCSTFMLYLGVDKVYENIHHHNILFAPDYRHNVDEITRHMVISEDPSIYIQNASVTDTTLAPEGHSAIYILVPIANNRSGIDWAREAARYRDKVLDLAETRGGLTDLRKHIVAERMITPQDWEEEWSVYRGAVFNLGHNLTQMLSFRPHNHFDDVDGCYLVGGGTHPGSGLPTIYESGRISAGLIQKRDALL